MFSEFTFRGEGGGVVCSKRSTVYIFIDIELWTQSLTGAPSISLGILLHL